MIALQHRTAEEGVLHHANDPVRVYSDHPVLKERIDRSVAMAQEALASVRRMNSPTVWELGCGTGDISGALSWACTVFGYDCHPGAIAKAHERWRKYGALYLCHEVETLLLPSISPDLLILCEILEHIPEPAELVRKWAPHFKAMLISHPVDGDLKGDWSGGDHCYSYSTDDFFGWFKMAGHEIQRSEMFTIGEYNIALGWSRNEALCRDA